MPFQPDADFMARVDAAIRDTPPMTGASAEHLRQWLAAQGHPGDQNPTPDVPVTPPSGVQRTIEWITAKVSPYNPATAAEQIRQLQADPGVAATRAVATTPFALRRATTPTELKAHPIAEFIAAQRKIPLTAAHPCMPPVFEPAVPTPISRDDAWHAARTAKRAEIAQRDAEAARLHDEQGLTYRQVAEALDYITPSGAALAAKRHRERTKGQRPAAPPPPTLTEQQNRDREAARLNASGFTYDAIATRLGYANRGNAYKAAQRGAALLAAHPDPAPLPSSPTRHRPGNFAPGDMVRNTKGDWRQVRKVNTRTLTVVADRRGSGRTLAWPYRSITGHRRAAELELA